ncbi:hypothetical protein [Pelagicoccus mobilis]|uniref:Holin-X, holin superfamily III n=1 Tax=Pelagicoccus mobilis TaxID=415221 RepID=A0A934RYX0_9BACT|nr:hypothetical protein [Pelagicoccus mobilis]MBK1879146.1 hypothetical protein [Pelagicoccus mobilis]
MEKTILKLRILARAQATLFQISTRRWVTTLVFLALALSFLLITIAMVNVAAYMSLMPEYGGVKSALMVGGGNLAIAVLLGLWAASMGPKADEKMVREIRDTAFNEVSGDVEEVRASIGKVKSDVGSIRELVGAGKGLVGSRVDFGTISAIVGFLIRLLRRRKPN